VGGWPRKRKHKGKRFGMQKFKKKKLLMAILASGMFSSLSHALSHTDAMDLGFWLGSTTAGVSLPSAAYVPDGFHLVSNDFLWIRNADLTGYDHDTALFLLDKNSSLTYLHNVPGMDSDGFRNSVISSYTAGTRKYGIAVEIGSNSFSLAERPALTANNTDFFADKTGLQINSGIVKLSNVAISASNLTPNASIILWKIKQGHPLALLLHKRQK
jgi:hypothetical protein